jgi:hypothetical protein
MESSNASVSSEVTLLVPPSILTFSPLPLVQISKAETASSEASAVCMLISGWVAMSAQLVLLAVVITALTIKRYGLMPAALSGA